MPAETRIQTQAEADEKMVDLPSEGDHIDVELPKDSTKIVNSDDDKDVDVGEKEVVETTASEGEMEDYGKKVQSRIDKLTKKLRESERREAAAIEFAQGVQGQQKKLQEKARLLDSGYVNEFANRVEAQTSEAKKQLKEAMDLGDFDKQVEAQQKMARLAVEADRAKKSQDQRERLKKEMEARGIDPNQPQMPQQQQPYPQPQQPPPPPDPKADAWADKNKWFGEDEPMTLTSFSIHRKLVEEGFDPSSEMYYNEIDKRMKETFPHRFDNETKSSPPTQSVASANRGGPIRRKGTVRLTPSQVAISKKLGVPLSEYAKYVKE